jgi:hypothetical protein
MIELKNDELTIRVAEKGAELQSVKDSEGREYMWQADPQFWPRHSPILFPLVCSVNDDTYVVDGREYHLPRHGFARDKDFTLVSQTLHFLIYLLLCSFALSLDERLAKNGASLSVPILGKANELVSTVRKQLVVYMDALEERIEVIVGITKIVQFNDFSAFRRKVYFVLRTSIKEVAKLTMVTKPASLLLCPFFQPCQLDRLARRCSRKSFNLFKDSLRDCGCAFQNATFCFISAFTFL